MNIQLNGNQKCNSTDNVNIQLNGCQKWNYTDNENVNIQLNWIQWSYKQKYKQLNLAM